jgi:hypothetical protein
MAVEELFVMFGSPVVELTVAVLDESEAELNVAAFTLIVTTTKPPTLIDPRLHVTVVVPEQLPCVVEDDVKVTSPGSGSVTTTFWAMAGPLFVT